MKRMLGLIGIIMSVIFVFFGIMIPINPPAMFANMHPFIHWLMAVLLVSYGIFRFVRAYKTLKSE